MTIINVCFYDGTTAGAKKIAEGLNLYAGVSETLVYSSVPDKGKILKKYLGEGRKFTEKETEDSFELLRAKMVTDINDIKRTNESETESEPESESELETRNEAKFILNLSTANTIEAFTCGLVAIATEIEVYTIKGEKIKLSAFPDIGSIDITKRGILSKLIGGQGMTVNAISKQIGIGYRATSNALKKLESSKLVCKNGFDEKSGKGPKSTIYGITETGRMVLSLIIPDRDELYDDS